MAGADPTSVSAALKENYAKNMAKVLWDDPQLTPALGILEKRSGKYDAGGRSFIQPIQYGDGSSISADFATAQAKAQGSSTGASNLYTRWSCSAVKVNAVAFWDRDVIDQIQGESAFFDLAEAEMDAKMRGIRRDLGRFLWGDGYGAIGLITAISATTVTIALDRVNRVDVGDDLVASATNGGGVLRSATSRAVTQTDPDTGILTVDADPTALGWAAGDSLFRKGDRQNAASPVQQKLFGFDAWVPGTAPGATLFNAVNRQGIWQLGGLRSNATGKSIKKGLLDAANKLFNMGGTKVTHCFMATDDYGALCDQLDNVKHIAVEARQFKISFDGIELIGAQGGAIKVLPEPYMPKGNAWMGDFSNGDNAYLIYSNDFVNVDDHDGNMFLRSATAAAYECRMYFFGNLVVAAPGRFIRVTNVGL
jgi:hypothetical protein